MSEELKINANDWAPLKERLVNDIIEKSKDVWSKAPDRAWVEKLAGEIAEYKYKMELAKSNGEKEKAEAYENTLKMVASQIEARAEEMKIHIKQGMLDTLKKVIMEVLQFAIKLALPLL